MKNQVLPPEKYLNVSTQCKEGNIPLLESVLDSLLSLGLGSLVGKYIVGHVLGDLIIVVQSITGGQNVAVVDNFDERGNARAVEDLLAAH